MSLWPSQQPQLAPGLTAVASQIEVTSGNTHIWKLKVIPSVSDTHLSRKGCTALEVPRHWEVLAGGSGSFCKVGVPAKLVCRARGLQYLYFCEVGIRPRQSSHGDRVLMCGLQATVHEASWRCWRQVREAEYRTNHKEREVPGPMRRPPFFAE
jgi:hypothetical protein